SQQLFVISQPEHMKLPLNWEAGCPNGCGRAMLAEIGLVGKAPGRYNLHLGGNRNGTRIPKMYRYPRTTLAFITL
ncbi:hypothetical protein, partial [Vibrio cholerae]|uniref:hypothetical protein n=1 Tax=Vibrio cholerae TaxID=666 RepID=UPI003D301155